MKLLLNKKGFSLIELMVVVAIIGILASVAVPNFQRFQRKARQSEAKTNLSSIYTAQKAFFAEWNSYTGDLLSAGYTPEGTLRYNTGFATDFTTAPIGYFGTLQAGRHNTNAICATLPCTSSALGLPASVASAAAFTAGATGNINGTAVNDQWTINQDKLLQNTIDGL